jgi:hypothetical protein
MQAILTKFLGYTNTKPSRISVRGSGVGNKHRLVISKESLKAVSTRFQHAEAARLYCQKMGWDTIGEQLIGGLTGENEGVFFFYDDVIKIELKK